MTIASVQTDVPASPTSIAAPTEFDLSELIRPSYQFYSPGAVALATLLGGPAGGFLVLILNYWSLRRWAAAWVTAAVGLLVCAALIPVLLRLPDKSPANCIGLPIILVLYAAALWLQGPHLKQHLLQGGERASLWKAAGWGLVGAILFLVVGGGIIECCG